MIDPKIWAGVPYRSTTAWSDFVGSLALWHRALADVIFGSKGATYRTYPLGSGGGQAWQKALERQHMDASAALGIAGPQSLSGYDLEDPTEFASFTWVVSQEAERLRRAAGIS